MACEHTGALLPRYFDDELDRASSRDFELHLDGCVECRGTLEALDALRRCLRSQLPRHRAPAALQARIESAMAGAEATAASRALPRRSGRPRQRWLALAASWLLAFGAGMGSLALLKNENPGDPAQAQLGRDLFASHWRALAASSAVDVLSTDQHTVKPWFAGKVALAPSVQDFAGSGFALVGGRIDYLADNRVPVLVYRHGQHLIDVFVLPGAAGGLTTPIERQGYTLLPVQLGGQAAVIVSDMDETERGRFARLLAAAR